MSKLGIRCHLTMVQDCQWKGKNTSRIRLFCASWEILNAKTAAWEAANPDRCPENTAVKDVKCARTAYGIFHRHAHGGAANFLPGHRFPGQEKSSACPG